MNYTKEKILSVVANYYNIEEIFIHSRLRNKEYVLPRQMFFYLCKKFTDFTLENMALFLGKGHDTALHSIKKISNEIELYSLVKNDVIKLTEIIKNEPDLIIKDINLLQLSQNYTSSFI